MNYADYIEYLNNSKGISLGLERITALMEKLGNPQDRTKIIHIAGTNGKGSLGAMLSEILIESGYRTGSFSSPALTGVTDYFRINNTEITEKDFTEIMDIIYPVCESMEEKPTEFEILTAVAFVMFGRKKCDIAIVECGMGGDSDSTNIIKSPVLSAITNVQKDHTGILGKTINEIASHKAGIIKPGVPVYFGAENIPEPIKNKARENNAELFTPDKKNISEPAYSLSGTEFYYKNIKINLSLMGTYQYINAVNAISCIEILRGKGLDIPNIAVKSGLEKVKWHGRFEIIRREPLIIFDGAHNPDGIKYFTETLDKYFNNKIVLLTGVLADKEYTLYADMLKKYTEIVFAVTPDNPRALDSVALAGSFSAVGVKALAYQDIEPGVRQALSYAEKHNLPLVAVGSLYMYKDFIKYIN